MSKINRRGFALRKNIRTLGGNTQLNDLVHNLNKLKESSIIPVLMTTLEQEIQHRKVLEEAVRTLWEIIRTSDK